MNAESLFQSLKNRIPLKDEEFQVILTHFEYRSIQNREVLVTEGELNDKIFFIEQGLLFSYKEVNNENAQVIQFAKEGFWLSDLYSFFSEAAALFSIKALEECKLWVLSKSNFEFICKSFPKIDTFFRLNFQHSYIKTLIRLSDAYSKDAERRYHDIRSNQPDLLRRVPQYLIASYLGILPSSLSRIRNKTMRQS